MAATVPGSAGWIVSGDKTIEFAKSPLEFLEKRISQYGSKTFMSRALNKPTIFVTSNKGVREVLIDKATSFDLGYKDFGYIHDIYGDVLLFADEIDASRIRLILRGLFNPGSCQMHFAHCKYVADEFLSNLSGCNPVPLYETFKSYTTALCLSLFLDVHWSSSEYEDVRELCTRHWHGLISVPISVEIKGWSTSFNKAMKAKLAPVTLYAISLGGGASSEENKVETVVSMCREVSTVVLNAIIAVIYLLLNNGLTDSRLLLCKCLKVGMDVDVDVDIWHKYSVPLFSIQTLDWGCFIESVKGAGFDNVDEAAMHTLIFVSALIPKSLASLLTSFCIAMGGEKRLTMREKALENESLLENVLLEVQRLWPPFLGGRRISKEPVLIDGFKIPEGVAVGYITWMANRDPDVFSNPGTFMPERWETESKGDECVFTFGAGPRKCVGIGFINKLLKLTCQKLMSSYYWSIEGDECPYYKTLPVARPRQTLKAYFMPNS